MKNKIRDLTRKDRRVKRKEGEKNMNAKRCPHCGFVMRSRGASDTIGSLSWKCKNKKCGRTVWLRHKVKPAKPLIAMSQMNYLLRQG